MNIAFAISGYARNRKSRVRVIAPFIRQSVDTSIAGT
jgi:hypothetical protein